MNSVTMMSRMVMPLSPWWVSFIPSTNVRATFRHGRLSWSSRDPCLELAADEHGLVDEGDRELLGPAVAQRAREGEQVGGGPRAAVGQGQGVLGRQRDSL